MIREPQESNVRSGVWSRILFVTFSVVVVSLLLAVGYQQVVLRLMLRQALDDRDFKGARRALMLGAPLDTRAPSGYDLLMWACEVGDLSLVESMINRGIDVNAKDARFGNTTLHFAVTNEQLEVLRLVLARGADPNLRNKQGSTPLQIATFVRFENQEAMREHIIDLLLKHHANADIADRRGVTPLMWAAGRGNAAVVRRLLHVGANRSLRDSKGRTAINYADKNGHVEVIRVLKQTTN